MEKIAKQMKDKMGANLIESLNELSEKYQAVQLPELKKIYPSYLQKEIVSMISFQIFLTIMMLPKGGFTRLKPVVCLVGRVPIQIGM